MNAVTVKNLASVCAFCHAARSAIRPQPTRPRVCRYSQYATAKACSSPNRNRNARSSTTLHPPIQESSPTYAAQSTVSRTPRPSDVGRAIGVAQSQAFGILRSETEPEEKALLNALECCQTATEQVLAHPRTHPQTVDEDNTPAFALLSLSTRPETFVSLKKSLELLSNLAYKLVTHPYVFITPAILKAYVRTQAALERPFTFPEVFTLYATKPTPQAKSSRVTYSTPNPNKVAAAIPRDVANEALSSAVAQKDLDLCLAIISTSFTTAAYRRAQLVKHLTIPAAGLALSPLAAYTLASTLSRYQDTMDPSYATGIAFVGILSYIGFTAMIGIVAVTTSNDQMDRVTWAVGMPLRERWLREDERAAADRVAGAWGFKEQWRRGEEEGKEWEQLKDWIGLRGMVLDKVSLMEGME